MVASNLLLFTLTRLQPRCGCLHHYTRYNKARRASVDTGYMTVGANMAFADDDAADDWD